MLVTHLHADHVGSLGSLLSYNSCVLELLRQGKLDRLYQDTSTHRHQPPSHCYYEDLERVVERELRGRVYCMHLDEDCREMLREKGFGIPVVRGGFR